MLCCMSFPRHDSVWLLPIVLLLATARSGTAGVPFRQDNNSSSSTSVTHSRVMVHIPFHLHNASGEEHVFVTQFGAGRRLNAAGSLSAFAYFWQGHTNHNLCHAVDLVNDAAAAAKNASTSQLFPIPSHAQLQQQQQPPQQLLTSPFILMAVASTACSPVLQARHAQQAGAAALILTDPTCRCAD